MPRRQRKTGVREDAEETRNTIVRTAERLFMEYGYRAVSTRQIADACGLTQPALYHYFTDKQELYVAVLHENITKTQAALERIVRRNESVQERLRLIVRYLLGTTQHDIGLMLHDIQHELAPQVQEMLHRLFQAGLIAPIASVFEDGLRQGLLRDPHHGGVDATTAAYLFMSMLSRFLARPQYAHDRLATLASHYTSDGEQAELIVNILLYGLVRSVEDT